MPRKERKIVDRFMIFSLDVGREVGAVARMVSPVRAEEKNAAEKASAKLQNAAQVQ